MSVGTLTPAMYLAEGVCVRRGAGWERVPAGWPTPCARKADAAWEEKAVSSLMGNYGVTSHQMHC